MALPAILAGRYRMSERSSLRLRAAQSPVCQEGDAGPDQAAHSHRPNGARLEKATRGNIHAEGSEHRDRELASNSFAAFLAMYFPSAMWRATCFVRLGQSRAG